MSLLLIEGIKKIRWRKDSVLRMAQSPWKIAKCIFHQITCLGVICYTKYVKLMRCRMTSEQAAAICKLSKQPRTGNEKNQYLLEPWEPEHVRSFKYWVTLVKQQKWWYHFVGYTKMVTFDHIKKIDTLKLGCLLRNIAIICLRNSMRLKIDLFNGSKKYFLETIGENIVGGSFVFKREKVIRKTFVLKMTNICKSIDVIEAFQLYPYS